MPSLPPSESHLTIMFARNGLLLSTVWECVEQIDAGPAFAALRDELRIEAIEVLEMAIDGVDKLMDDPWETTDQCWASEVLGELRAALEHMRRCDAETSPPSTPPWALDVLRSLAEHEADGAGDAS